MKRIEYTYEELTSLFRAIEEKGKEQIHIVGYIVFTKDSFTKPYTEEERTYIVSSDNKAFQPNKGGYSIYANCLDGKDLCVRIERYMAKEKGGADGWKVEKCYIDADNLVGSKLARDDTSKKEV